MVSGGEWIEHTLGARDGEALPRAQGPTADYLRHHAIGADLPHLEQDLPVGEPHGVAHVDQRVDLRHVRRDPRLGRGLSSRREREAFARFERDQVARYRTDAELRARQVDEHAEVATELVRHGAATLGSPGVCARRAVGAVQAYDVDAPGHHRAKHCLVLGARSQRCHDLRATHLGWHMIRLERFTALVGARPWVNPVHEGCLARPARVSA